MCGTDCSNLLMFISSQNFKPLMIKANKTSVFRKRTVAAGRVAKVEKIQNKLHLSGQVVYFILVLHIYCQEMILNM